MRGSGETLHNVSRTHRTQPDQQRTPAARTARRPSGSGVRWWTSCQLIERPESHRMGLGFTRHNGSGSGCSAAEIICCSFAEFSELRCHRVLSGVQVFGGLRDPVMTSCLHTGPTLGLPANRTLPAPDSGLRRSEGRAVLPGKPSCAGTSSSAACQRRWRPQSHRCRPCGAVGRWGPGRRRA